MNKSKGIYLIVGASGSGKTSIVEELQSRNSKYTSIQSYTTRPKRYSHEMGHTFITEEEFDNLKDICAYVKYNGYRYCATSEQVDNNLLYVIDPKGVEYFKANYKGTKTPYIVYIDVPWHTRLYRMLKRKDGIRKSLSRIIIDSKQFKGAKSTANCIIKNEDLWRSASKLKSFILETEQYKNWW